MIIRQIGRAGCFGGQGGHAALKRNGGRPAAHHARAIVPSWQLRQSLEAPVGWPIMALAVVCDRDYTWRLN